MTRPFDLAIRFVISLYSWGAFIAVGALYVVIMSPVTFYAAATGAKKSPLVERGNVLFCRVWSLCLFFARITIFNRDRYAQVRRETSRLVVVCNHQSLIDMIVITPVITPFFTFSKEWLGQIPFMARFMRLGGNLFMAHDDPVGLRRVFAVAHERIKNGETFFLFPEGTRQGGAQLNSFKPGAFRLAGETGATLLPIAISGPADFVQNRSMLLTTVPPHHFRLHIGKPINPAAYKGDPAEGMALARQQIECLLQGEV